MGEAIIKKIREKGLLLEKEIYDLLNGFNDDTKANEFLEKVFINFGINLEVRRESEIISPTINANRKNSGYRVFYAETTPDKKIGVPDFVGYFRSRFQQLQR